MKKIKILSPATIANISCGFDIIGLAINNPNDEIIISKSKIPGINIKSIYGADLSTNVKKNVAGVALESLIKEYNNPNLGFELEIKKNILPGSGIGSSAASAAGAVIGANILLNNPFNNLELIKFSMYGEYLAGGKAHADNVAPIIMGGIVLIRDYYPLDVININIPKELWISIIHPQIEIKTSDSRAMIKKNILLENAVKQWGNIGGLISGFYKEDYDLIGRSLNDVIIEPTRSILIPEFYKIKNICKKEGALGGGISGSGPSVFMLSKGKEKALEISDIMSKIYSEINLEYKVYTSKINENGIKWSKIE